MACQPLGENAEARTELALGRQLIEAEFASGLTVGTWSSGWWFDWLFARILLREADGVVK